MSACITGWAHSKFGLNSEQTSENMIADVVDKAIKHAEISAVLVFNRNRACEPSIISALFIQFYNLFGQHVRQHSSKRGKNAMVCIVRRGL